ncbi:hypothetical protein ACOME3_001826 [Neoechinorhynchus agilis]
MNKRVTHCIYHPSQSLALTGSADTTIRTWTLSPSSTVSTCQVIRAHNSPITGLSLHPCGDYILSCSSHGSWAFTDIESGKVFTKSCETVSENKPSASTCAQFHPDGLIFAVGSESATLKIWDIKDRVNVANFEGHDLAIRAIAYSENGYYLASASDDATIKIWDLRKLKNIKSFELSEGFEVKDLVFDPSGVFLAVAGTDVRVYQMKQWETLVHLDNHSDLVTGLRFGENSRSLYTCSLDRSVKVYRSDSGD